MNKTIKSILIVEVQIILVLAVYLIVKAVDMEGKIYYTNTFMYELLADKRLNELSVVTENDIVMGDKDAPINMIVYTKFECAYCIEFFTETLPMLEKEYISSGLVKLTIRYLLSPSHEHAPFVELGYETFKIGKHKEFSELLLELSTEDLNKSKISEIQDEFKIKANGNFNFIKDKYLEALKAGIKGTPTFIINGKKYVGNRKMNQFRQILDTQFEFCE